MKVLYLLIRVDPSILLSVILSKCKYLRLLVIDSLDLHSEEQYSEDSVNKFDSEVLLLEIISL